MNNPVKPAAHLREAFHRFLEVVHARLGEGAERLGLVTLQQMVDTLVRAVEDPPAPGQIRIVEVPGIRSALITGHGVTETRRKT